MLGYEVLVLGIPNGGHRVSHTQEMEVLKVLERAVRVGWSDGGIRSDYWELHSRIAYEAFKATLLPDGWELTRKWRP